MVRKKSRHENGASEPVLVGGETEDTDGDEHTDQDTGDETAIALVELPPDHLVVLSKTHPYSYKVMKEVIRTMPKELAQTLSNMPIPLKKVESVVASIERIASGIWSVFPMLCPGKKCGYGIRCGFARENLAPIGQDCPLETYLISKWMDEYIATLSINVEDKVQMDQISTVIMSDLMIMRIRNFMARKIDGHIDESAVGVDSQGNVILKRDIAKEILIEEKYQKQKSKILEELLATKESRAKYDVIDEKDVSVRGAKLRYKAQQLKNTADMKADHLVKKAEFLEMAAKTMEISNIPEVTEADYSEGE